jgi:hypothetical protein
MFHSSKKKKYKCSYQDNWEKEFQWVKPSDRGATASDAMCILCKSHISISSGAKHDLIIRFYLVCLPYSIFPDLVDSDDMSLLQDQFDEYQTTHISELPTYTSESDIELFWGEMAKLFDIFVQKKRFNVLCKVAKTLLVLPNSNADSERVFFFVKKFTLNSDTT